MSSEKTEQPTQKKLRDARLKGDVAHSKDFTQTALVLALFGYLLFNATNIVGSLERLILIPANLVSLPFPLALKVAFDAVLREATDLLLPVLVLVLGLGLFIEFVQVGVVVAFEKLKPSGKKLNPADNLKNMFSKKSLVEFLKSVLKLVVLSVLVYVLVMDALPGLMLIPLAGVDGMALALGSMLRDMLAVIALAYTVIALADLAWQRFQFRRSQMMTKDEVRREFKEMDGDPHIKSKRKHLHQEMAMQNAVARTRKATVVVTNPTHLAVALYYEPDETPLPKVLAKGEGTLAAQMVRAAREEGIPVLQNIPLARALTEQVEPDQYIPAHLIEPVAEVLRLVRELTQDPDADAVPRGDRP